MRKNEDINIFVSCPPVIPALRFEFRRVREVEANLKPLKGLMASVYMSREAVAQERTGMETLCLLKPLQAFSMEQRTAQCL